MPLRLVSRSFWKNSANDKPDWDSMTFGNNSPPKRAFCALAIDALGDAWNTAAAGSPLTPLQESRIGLASQHAMYAAVAAVDLTFTAAGAGAVYTGHPLERCFRDLHTANQHIAFSGEGFRGYARHRFGQTG